MNVLKFKQTSALVCILLLGIFSTGCGKGIVTGVTVSTTEQSGDQYAQLDIQFATNGLGLPSLSLPIYDPNNPSVTYGNLGLDQASSSTGEVKLGIDLTVVAKLPGGTATLPNGTAVPVTATEATKLISIPIPTTRFVLYLAIQLNALQPGQTPTVMVGIALPFTQLDSIGSALGNADLFIPFGVDGVNGSAGVFSGKASGTSGVGLFVDVSGLIPQAPATRPEILSQSPGTAAELHIAHTLSRLGRRHTQLTVE